MAEISVRKAPLTGKSRPEVPISPASAGLQSRRPAPVSAVSAQGSTGPSAISLIVRNPQPFVATRGDF